MKSFLKTKWEDTECSIYPKRPRNWCAIMSVSLFFQNVDYNSAIRWNIIFMQEILAAMNLLCSLKLSPNMNAKRKVETFDRLVVLGKRQAGLWVWLWLRTVHFSSLKIFDIWVCSLHWFGAWVMSVAAVRPFRESWFTQNVSDKFYRIFTCMKMYMNCQILSTSYRCYYWKRHPVVNRKLVRYQPSSMILI